MDTREFIDLVTPDAGYKCLAIQQEKGFSHHFFNTAQSLAISALESDKTQTVFFALAGFITSKNRRGDNVQALRSFWFDIDCGEGKDYPDQASALTALFDFVKITGEQIPLVISSGNGIHCYWPMDRDIAPNDWLPVARKFKALAFKLGLRIDPTRTADMSSVLRPVGTHHKKQIPYKEVKALNHVASFQHDFVLFRDLVDELCAEHSVELMEHTRPTHLQNTALNADLMIKPSFAPSSAYEVANKCAQLANIRNTRGDVTEPVWYAGIGVLRHCTESPQIVHDWSNGHPGYDEHQTALKIQQHERNAAGPTSCAQFEEINSAACQSCPHRGKIKSPITLGVVKPQAVVVDPVSGMKINTAPQPDAGPQPAEITEHGIEAPFPYRRTADGLYKDTGVDRIAGDDGEDRDTTFDERFVKFYDYDVYVESIFHDNHVEGETFVIKHYMPQNGWQTCNIESQKLCRPDALHKELLKNHIKVKHNHVINMLGYLMGYLQELEKQKRIQELSMSMGWTDRNEFVLGERLFSANEPILHAQLSMGIKDSFCAYFANEGSLDTWTEATKIFDEPGMEGHAFALLLGFGAPLMKFTGYPGALVNLVGKSNAGKTSMTHWLTSIYGQFSELKAQKNDTVNSMFQRLGVFNSLPLIIDEITNVEGMELSDFVYTITQGRTKTRLNRSGIERKNPLRWNTLVISSSNERLSNKLGFAKADPEAEQLRLFEYELHRCDAFENNATDLIDMLEQNYGAVGEQYVQYITDHQDTIKENLKITGDTLMKMGDALPKERYWFAVLSCAIFGGKIAEACGLIKFNVDAIAQHMLKVVAEMRATTAGNGPDYMVMLGTYLNEFVQNRLVIERYGEGKTTNYQIRSYPKGPLYVRVEISESSNFLYIDRRHLNHWLHEKKLDIEYMERELFKSGVILNPRSKKLLGANWPENPGSSQVMTWHVNLDNPALGNTAVKLVEANKDLTTAVKG